jgi:Leucine-rich repeat (LRR) protein
LGAEGLVKIIQKLTGNFIHLEELNLSYNDIDDNGANLIEEMLRGKVNLSKLVLKGGRYDFDVEDDQVVDRIKAALTANGFPDAWIEERDEIDESD